MLSKKELRVFEEMLRGMLNDLWERTGRRGEIPPEELIGEPHEICAAILMRDMGIILQSRLREKIIEIIFALERIEDKTYGMCEECGEDILTKRLNVNPCAQRCIDCQEDHERQHGPRPGLLFERPDKIFLIFAY